MTEWETVERPPLPEPWDVKEAPVVGVFVETKTIKTKDQFNQSGTGSKMSTYHVLRESETGSLCGLWGSPDLDGKMEQVNAGDIVRVEYVETTRLHNGRPMKLYDVKKRAAGATPAEPSHSGAVATDAEGDIPF